MAPCLNFVGPHASDFVDEAIGFGLITVYEASLPTAAAQTEAIFERCLCLELGQALLATAADPAAAALACDILHAAADCVRHDPLHRAAAAVQARPQLPGEAGRFLRELYYNWAVGAKRQSGGSLAVGEAAARAVHERAVRDGVWTNALQRPASSFLPALRSRPFWDPATLPAVRALEAHAEEIVAECRALLGSQYSFYRDRGGAGAGGAHAKLVTQGEWSDVQLFAGCRRDEAHCALCPRTAAVLAAQPSLNTVVHSSHFVSRLTPGTHIAAHCGPSNYRLRCHLGVQVPAGARIRVGDETRPWVQGKVLVFDDSFEHEVWHDGPEDEGDRIVLICDIWHPDLDVAQAVLPSLSSEQRAAFDAASAGAHLPLRKTAEGLAFSRREVALAR